MNPIRDNFVKTRMKRLIAMVIPIVCLFLLGGCHVKNETVDPVAGEPGEPNVFDQPEDVDPPNLMPPTNFLISEKVVQLYFNEPGANGAQNSILENEIIKLIELAEPGSDIKMSIYHFYRAPIAQALIEAQSRGVTIRVVFGDDNEGRAGYETVKNGYAGLPGLPANRITVCGNACLGDRGNNHNKYILFSKLSDGREFVVVKTSGNFTNGQLKMFNDLIVINGDQKLYNIFVDYWIEQFGKNDTDENQGNFYGESGIKTYFYPRPNKGDTFVNILEKVSCFEGAKIYLAHSRLTRDAVAEELSRLSNEGCDVRVIGRNEPDRDSPSRQVRKILGETLLFLPYKEPNNTYSSIHTKLMLLDVKYGESQRRRRLVFTGSHNLNENSLRYNDETMLRFEDEEVFETYMTFWQKMRKMYEDYKAAGLALQP